MSDKLFFKVQHAYMAATRSDEFPAGATCAIHLRVHDSWYGLKFYAHAKSNVGPTFSARGSSSKHALKNLITKINNNESNESSSEDNLGSISRLTLVS